MATKWQIFRKRYIFASSIKIGKSIDRNRSFGDFVFSCDSETTFDANSDVEISAGTEIQRGAIVNIFSKRMLSFLEE